MSCHALTFSAIPIKMCVDESKNGHKLYLANTCQCTTYVNCWKLLETGGFGHIFIINYTSADYLIIAI